MNAEGKAVTQIKYTFNGWKGKSGTITINSGSGWPISSRKFEIKNDLIPTR